MKLTPPKNVTWFVALILAVAGLLGYLKVIVAIEPYAFWLALIAAGLLLLAAVFRGL